MDLIGSLHQLAVLATGRPTPQELVRALAVQVLHRFEVTSVQLLRLNERGDLVQVASFGEIGSRPCQRNLEQHGSIRACPAQRGSRPTTCREVDPAPWLSALRGTPRSEYLFCLPLMLRGLLMGTCLIGTRIDPRPQEHGTFWETVGLCLAAQVAESNAPATSSTGMLEPTPAMKMPAVEMPEVNTPERKLSARQRRILDLVAEGMTNQQIGNRLGYSESTIGHDLVTAYERLGVRNREDAVRVIRQHQGAEVPAAAMA
ncbi:MAG: response regulator transcription factor [Actinomycetales bacterium]